MKDNRLDSEAWKRVFEPLSAKHFTPEEERAWVARQAASGEDVNAAWMGLVDEGRALLARGLDPSSDEAMDLGRRWMAMLNRLSGGDPAIHAKIEAMWKEAFQDEDFREKSPMTPELMDYVGEAIRSAHVAGLVIYPGAARRA